MMRDPALLQRVERAIAADGLSAEAALARATASLHAELEGSPLPMARDKAADVLDIGHRLLRCLDPRVESRALHGEPTVLVASTLTPSELVRFAHRGPCAALTESCGPRSHTAILADLRYPARRSRRRPRWRKTSWCWSTQAVGCREPFPGLGRHLIAPPSPR
jgi:phosphoenolpyruvate-protein kinase (PTS system EI component)